MAVKSLLQIVSLCGEFNLFVAAAHAARMEGVLEGAEPLTVLAPVDAAFGAVTDEVLEWLIDRRRANLAELVDVHLVLGAHTLRDMIGLGAVESRHGELLCVDAFESCVAVDGAVVVRRDVPAANGILHGIDQVLAPRRLRASGSGQASNSLVGGRKL